MVKLDANQCALVVLRAIEERGQRRGKPLTRARLSSASLKALWISRDHYPGMVGSDQRMASLSRMDIDRGWRNLRRNKSDGR